MSDIIRAKKETQEAITAISKELQTAPEKYRLFWQRERLINKKCSHFSFSLIQREFTVKTICKLAEERGCLQEFTKLGNKKLEEFFVFANETIQFITKENRRNEPLIKTDLESKKMDDVCQIAFEEALSNTQLAQFVIKLKDFFLKYL